MNSTSHWTQHLRLTRYPQTDDLFRLDVTYNGWPAEQVVSRVHVPKPLQSVLLSGHAPLGLQLLSLEIGGIAGSALPDAPEHVVVGVTMRDGSRVWHYPRHWVQLRQRMAGLVAATGIAVLTLAPMATQSGCLAVAVLSVTATLVLSRAVRAFKAVGFRAFATSVEVGRLAADG